MEKKGVTTAQRKIRRRLMKLEEEDIREEEEMVVEYMDSDEEEKKMRKKTKSVEVSKEEELEKELENEEAEEAYTIPPMETWTPAEKSPPSTFLSFRPVELPTSDTTCRGKPVRSTILGKFGRSVIIGPPPVEQPWEMRHSRSTLMMVSPEQLRAHLLHQAERVKNLNSGPQRNIRAGRLLSQAMDKKLEYELQAAVTPWIGNLLIPEKSRPMTVDTLRERGERRQLSSTPIFMLFLQTMNVDSVGCKEMIEKKRSRMVFPTSDSSLVRLKNPKTVAGVLQRRREEQQGFGRQQSPFLEQLPQIRPGTLQRSPKIHPHMSPVLFPQAVFIPVAQPPATSTQLLTTPPADTSVLPPPPAPQTLCMLPAPTSTPSTSSAGPLTENLVSNSSTLTGQDAVPSGCSSPNQPPPALSPSSSILSPGDKQKAAKATISNQNGLDADGADGVSDVEAVCTGLMGDGVDERKYWKLMGNHGAGGGGV